MSSLPQSRARGRSAVLLAAAVVVTTVWSPVGARPALAHEFALALVTPTSDSANDLNGSDVIDGFRLAVDQSPDVSHPAGADAGDHLGGVDVDVSVIDGAEAAEAAEAVKQQLATGLTAVVVIAADRTARAVAKELEGSSVLLVTADGAGASAPSDAGALHLTQGSAPPFESGAAADAASAFERAYGRELSAASALGYDAGRLLDSAVARADAGVEDLDSVVAAASEVDDELVSSDVSAAAEQERVNPPDPAADTDPGRLLLIVVIATGMLLALLGAGWRARCRRGSGG